MIEEKENEKICYSFNDLKEFDHQQIPIKIPLKI
jgi:hypothetical protein